MCLNRISRVSAAWVAAVAWLLCSPSSARAFQVEAVAGEPFGVGRIVLSSSPATMPPVLGPKGLALHTPDGRILYPVVETPPDNTFVKDLLLGSRLLQGGPGRELAGGIVREFLKRPPTVTLYFLFRGDDPLRVTLQGRTLQKFVVHPRRDPHAQRARVL